MSNETNSEGGLAPLSYKEASKIVCNDEFIEALRDAVVEAIGSVMPVFLRVEDVLSWCRQFEMDDSEWFSTPALARVVMLAQEGNRNPSEWHPVFQDALIALFFSDEFGWNDEKLAPHLAIHRIGVTAINHFATDTYSYWRCIITNCKMTLFRDLDIPKDDERDDGRTGNCGTRAST